MIIAIRVDRDGNRRALCSGETMSECLEACIDVVADLCVEGADFCVVFEDYEEVEEDNG